MKKHILKYLMIGVALVSMSSCEDFLDSTNYTEKDTGNFPTNISDANQMLTGIYSTLSMTVTDCQHSHFYMAELASDDRFGGGGENDRDMQGLDHFMNTKADRFRPFWKAKYTGIYRANFALETLDQCEGWTDENHKNRYKGEAYFMRALFYFELAQMFGEIPLITHSLGGNFPKSPASEVYALIAQDLKNAIDMLPSSHYSETTAGHATKWAAEALMARVFLFYTGYYKQSTLPLPEGGNISKTEVIKWLEDCITNSGHGLVSDFRNLWPYTNEFTAKNYEYVSKNNLQWEGDGNKETVFAIKFGTSVDWGNDFQTGYSNQYMLHFGLRADNGTENTFPYGQGWGAGPVNPNLVAEWKKAEPNDIRLFASVLDVKQELPSYSYGADKQMEETGLWQKKYMPISAYKDGEFYASYATLKDEAKNEMQLAHTQDLVLIRFADVLLMHSELKEDATSMNLVRKRAGLKPIGYSLAAIQNERRWELSFEGLRYFDIMRWGIAGEMLAKQEGVDIKNRGIDTKMRAFGGGYKARYEATGGFWAIPESQIDLSDGVLTQNKGWGTPEVEYPGW